MSVKEWYRSAQLDADISLDGHSWQLPATVLEEVETDEDKVEDEVVDKMLLEV